MSVPSLSRERVERLLRRAEPDDLTIPSSTRTNQVRRRLRNEGSAVYQAKDGKIIRVTASGGHTVLGDAPLLKRRPIETRKTLLNQLRHFRKK